MALGKRTDKPLVLIGFAEAMAAIESAWSLQRAGFRVAAFQRTGSRSALRHVRDVDIFEVARPETDAEGAVQAVTRLANRLGPAVLLPLDDAALWLCHRLETGGFTVAGAQGTAVCCALDKSIQVREAAAAGLPVPWTQVVTNLTGTVPEQFPVMVKPAMALYEVDGVLKRPTGVVCAGAEEYARAAATEWPGPMLIQPLIRGTGEGLFGHFCDGSVVAWSAHRRVRMVNPQGSASSACRSEQVDEELVEASERFLKAIGWRGLFMLEFLRDTSGRPWFMELNGRTWGSMALARHRGFEYPAWTVRAALDEDFRPDPPSAPPETRCRNLGLELAHLAFVARGPQSGALTEWPRLGNAIRDVCSFTRHDRLYNWNRSQPAVLVADLLETLSSYGRRLVSGNS